MRHERARISLRAIAAVAGLGGIVWTAGCGLLRHERGLLDRTPSTLNLFLALNPSRLDSDPAVASSVNWSGIRENLTSLGLVPAAFSSIALMSLAGDDGRSGQLILGRARSGGMATTLDRSAAVAFELAGLSFRACPTTDWYWAEDQGWITLCDRSGCMLGAASVTGHAAAVTAAPPESILPILRPVDESAPVTLLWIPTSRARDEMEAGSVWLGFSASVWMHHVAPSQLIDRLGLVRGARAVSVGDGSSIRVSWQFAMSSVESARLIAGTIHLSANLIAGLEGAARAFGATPPSGPSIPPLSCTSHENVIEVTAVLPPNM